MSNLTVPSDGLGPLPIQQSDFYHGDSILHPIIVGTIALFLLFCYLRFSSNRSLAQMSVFDAIVSVATGSTIAGIVNGTSLVRGLLAIFVLFFFQYITSWITGRFPRSGTFLAAPPLIVAFRGDPLGKVMRRHRISMTDLNSALRKANVWSISEVEVVAIEPTGSYSVYKRSDYPKEYEPDVLWDMPGYKALREQESSQRDNNDVAEEQS